MAKTMERWQVPLYLAALACGAVLGWLIPGGAHTFAAAINPALILLLYATFLAVPFDRIRDAFTDLRFMGAVVVLNFVIVPLVVLALSRFVASDTALLVGVLLVLLTPCIDYVMVFSRLAGGDAGRLLAASPVQMVLQMALLPLWLVLLAGGEVLDSIDLAPFVKAFLLLIVVPLGLSILTQRAAAAHVAPARRIGNLMGTLMVPLMMVTLLVVVASQFAHVVADAALLVRVIPVFVAFLVVMPLLGNLVGRLARLDVPGRRALAFTGSTRNSLVVLPLALALPEALSLSAVVVVMQTLVELVGMVVFVRLIPRLVRGPVSV